MPSNTAIPRPDTDPLDNNDAPTPRPQAAGLSVPEFNIETWRAAAKVPRRTVPVTNDPGVGLRLAEIAERMDAIKAKQADAAFEGKPVRGKRAGSTSHPDLDALKAEADALTSELDGTWMYVHVRALTPHESNKVADHENRVDRIAQSLALVARIAPTREHPGEAQSAQQWHDLLDVIGHSQTLTLEQAINEITVAAVTPDFSRRVSEALAGATSSSS